jgi:hypothetical protein
MRKLGRGLILAIAALVTSCSAYYMASYNEVVDSGAAELQANVDGFLAGLEETVGTPAGAYEQQRAFYEQARHDIRMLRNVAAAQPGNDLTLQSLDLIDENVVSLEAMHAKGISPHEIGVLRKLFGTQFRMLLQLETAKKREVTQ